MEKENNPKKIGRRGFLARISTAGAAIAFSPLLSACKGLFNKNENEISNIPPAEIIDLILTVNGQKHQLNIDPRVTLLDALREKLSLFGTKKGCDHGQCGACTVLINDRRVNSCLTLAAICEGDTITTIEGLGSVDNLHPMQKAFIKHDAFQCGYCTPGQICSAVGLVNEEHAKTTDDIKELMSGNICRCAAYQNIFNAVREVYNKV